tara:strand:- start:329 stop:505 length:177 start_codon:yes stop_codon:yes gene_type:complete
VGTVPDGGDGLWRPAFRKGSIHDLRKGSGGMKVGGMRNAGCESKKEERTNQLMYVHER